MKGFKLAVCRSKLLVRKNTSHLLYNEITVIFGNKCCSPTITEVLSKRHTGKRESERGTYP